MYMSIPVVPTRSANRTPEKIDFHVELTPLGKGRKRWYFSNDLERVIFEEVDSKGKFCMESTARAPVWRKLLLLISLRAI